MGLSIATPVFAAPTTNGNDTVLSGLDNPKAILLASSFQTAAGETDGDGVLSVGIGTYRGAAVAQRVMSIFDDDAVGTSVVAWDGNNDALLRLRSAAGTVDGECDLVSMDADDVTIDWNDAPTSAIKCGAFIIGGSAVTDALVDQVLIGASSGTQDDTVVAGFGKPDLLIGESWNRPTTGTGTGTGALGLFAGKDDSNVVEALQLFTNGAANMDIAQGVKADRFGQRFTGTTLDGESKLSARASWPTDGFQLDRVDAYTLTNLLFYLALRFDATVSVAMGRSDTITGGTTVTLPGASGTVPRGLLIFHGNIPASSSINTNHADLGYFGVGAYDGTTQWHAGIGQDDGNTTSVAYRTWSESKCLRMFSPAASGSVQAEASAAFSGKDAVLTFSDLDSIARSFCWLLISEVVPTTFKPQTRMI